MGITCGTAVVTESGDGHLCDFRYICTNPIYLAISEVKARCEGFSLINLIEDREKLLSKCD